MIKTKGENINISWSPDGNAIAVGNKVKILPQNRAASVCSVYSALICRYP